MGFLTQKPQLKSFGKAESYKRASTQGATPTTKTSYHLCGDNMVKNKYKHFNPEKYKIESKIATVKRGHHCKFNINYHLDSEIQKTHIGRSCEESA